MGLPALSTPVSVTTKVTDCWPWLSIPGLDSRHLGLGFGDLTCDGSAFFLDCAWFDVRHLQTPDFIIQHLVVVSFSLWWMVLALPNLIMLLLYVVWELVVFRVVAGLWDLLLLPFVLVIHVHL